MHKTILVALGAASMLFASPVIAQDFPVKGGDYWTVAEITIDDGHFGDYADHLAGLYRKSMDFQKSKGWIKSSYILANVNKRVGEPDLYLVTIADRPTTPAEDEATARDEPAEEGGLRPEDENRIHNLFEQSRRDRAHAYELKRELDRLGVYREYEDRFLDLFKLAE